ncbi:MAG: hypothetical protein PUF12_08080 [Thermoflexaceae bacterium]|nr:hypothetical protein [Thermoflexaceae bacterium]
MQIFPRSLFLSISREIYVVSLESINWQKTFFWILLAFLIAVLVIYGKKKIFLQGSLIVLLIFDMYLYVQPASYFYAAESFDAADYWQSPINYYFYDDDNEANIYWELAQGVSEDFKVEQYVLELECDRVLSVRAEIIPDRKLKEYPFTLAHEYAITGLTDAYGNDLEYERMGDYFIIKEPFEGSFHIQYEGAADWFPANRNVMALSPFFPWYPQAGIHEVFDMDTWSYKCQVLSETSNFDVKVTTPGTVYSNLLESGKNVFHGESRGCLLMKGVGMDITYVEDNKIVYPRLLYRTEEEAQKKYCELMRQNGEQQNLKLTGDWYVIPVFGNGTYGRDFFIMEDCFGGYADTLGFVLKYPQRFWEE